MPTPAAKKLTPRRRAPKKSPKTRKAAKAPKTLRYVQYWWKVARRAFGPNPRCVPDGEASAAERVRKTPVGDPEKCVGSVRIGRDNVHLYRAERVLQKNPRIKHSTTPTGQGYHVSFRWKKLLDARTKKAFKITDAPQGVRFLA